MKRAARRNKRAEYLVTRFGVYEGPDTREDALRELARMGAAAVPTLIAFLADKEEGWNAAMVLAEIGAPAAVPAIPALLRHAKNPRSACALHAAGALGTLGQLDALVELANKASTRWVAIAGLKSLRPASYPVFEALLDRKDRAAAKDIAEWLAPGTASWEPGAADLDGIIAASRSRHVILRKDAACSFADLHTGADRARSVPPLVAMLGDTSSEVRRLALLALGYCRGHAKDALPAIRACLQDKTAAVRDTAQHAIAEIEKRRSRR